MNFERLTRASADLRLPAAFVDLEAWERNLKQLTQIARAGGKTVRLATKSIRVPALIERAVKSDPVFRGLLLYSCEEIPLLSRLGLDDFIIAYPTVQKSDLVLAWAHAHAGGKVALVVDSIEHARAIESARPQGTESKMRVVVDCDMSWRPLGNLVHLGVRRSPVRTPQALRELLLEMQLFSGVVCIGLMGYEAQVAGLSDKSPFSPPLNPVKNFVRRGSMRWIRRHRMRLRETFEQALGKPPEVFNGGGTGSFNWAASETVLTEITAGSALACTALFDTYTNIQFEPAAYFALLVSRKSDTDRVTCSGGGYIASGEPGWDRLPCSVWPEGLSWVETEGCGEVQTPLHGTSALDIKVGDRVYFRPAKAGEWLERFATVHLVREDRIAESVRTYRSEGLVSF